VEEDDELGVVVRKSVGIDGESTKSISKIGRRNDVRENVRCKERHGVAGTAQ